MISADVHIHQARHGLVALGVLVIGKTLHEGRGTIADTHDADADLSRTHADSPLCGQPIACILEVPKDGSRQLPDGVVPSLAVNVRERYVVPSLDSWLGSLVLARQRPNYSAAAGTKMKLRRFQRETPSL
jgi:hypothetical protein